MEAAHTPWRPLGQLLVDEGLLTPGQLEEALDNQATTGRRLGEIAVEFGFVSHMALSRVLSAQYGVELKSETGFGTGLRAELERRHDQEHESLEPPEFIVAQLPPLQLAPPLSPVTEDARLTDLEEELEALRQTSEYGHEEATRLSEALNAREAELDALREAHDRRNAQAAKFAARMRSLQDELVGRREDSDGSEDELAGVQDELDRRRAQAAKFATRLRERETRLREVESDLEVLWEEAERGSEQNSGELTAARAANERRRRQAAKFAARMLERDEQLSVLESEHAAVRELAKARYDEAERLAADLSDRDGRLAAMQGELSSLRTGPSTSLPKRGARRTRRRPRRRGLPRCWVSVTLGSPSSKPSLPACATASPRSTARLRG